MAYVIADKPAGFDPFAKQGKKEKTYYVSDTPVDFDPFAKQRVNATETGQESIGAQSAEQMPATTKQAQPAQSESRQPSQGSVDVPPPAVARALSGRSPEDEERKRKIEERYGGGVPVLSAVRNVLRPDYVQEPYLLATPYSQKPTSDVVSSANAITEKYKKQSNSAWKPGQYYEQIKRLYELDSKQFNTGINATPAERTDALDATKKNNEEYNKLLATLPSSVQEQVAKDKAENRYYELKKIWPGDLVKSAPPWVLDEMRELDEQLHLTDSTFEDRVLSGRAKSWLDRVKFGQYAVHNAQQIATLFKEEPEMMQKAINRMRDMQIVAARDMPEGKSFVEKGFLGLLSNVAPMAESVAAGTVSAGVADKAYWAMQGKGSVIYDYVTENNLDLTKMSKEELAKLDAVSSVAGAAYAAVEYIGNMYGLQKAGMSPKIAKQFVQKAMKDGAFWEKVTRGGARFFVEWMKEGGEEFLQPLITTTGQQVLEGNVDVPTNIEESLNEWWDALPAAAFMVAGGGGIAKLGDRVEQNKAQQATELAAADRSAREAMRPQNAQMTQTDRGIVPNRPEIVAQAQEEQAPEFIPQPRTAQITDIEKQINRELAIEERIENKTRKASVEESMVFDREELNARRERLDPNKRSNLNDIAQYISENSDMSFDEAFKDAAAWRVRKRQKFLEALRNDSLENIEVELGLKERTPIVYEQAQATEDSSVTQEKQTQPISEQAPANTTTTPVKANEKKTVEPVRSSTITLQNKAGKTRTVDVVKETDTAFLYRDENGTQRRLMKTAWTKQTEQQVAKTNSKVEIDKEKNESTSNKSIKTNQTKDVPLSGSESPQSYRQRSEETIRKEIETNGLGGEFENFLARLESAKGTARNGSYGLQAQKDDQGYITGWYNQGKIYPEGFDAKSIPAIRNFIRGKRPLTQNQLDVVERAYELIQAEIGIKLEVVKNFKEDIKKGERPPQEVIDENPSEWEVAISESGINEDDLGDTSFDFGFNVVDKNEDAQVDSLKEWRKKHGIAEPDEQVEMFGKGAVGDVFELQSQVVKERESFSEKKAREEKQAKAEAAQTNMFEPSPEQAINRQETIDQSAPKGKESKLSFLNKLEAEARAEIETLKKSSTIGANKPIGIAANYVVIGAVKIAKGTVKFAEWSAQMIQEFGETIRPILKDIYRSSKDIANKHKDNPEQFIDAAKSEVSRLSKRNLSLISEDQSVRKMFSDVDKAMESIGEPKPETVQQWDTEAKKQYNANPELAYEQVVSGDLDMTNPVNIRLAKIAFDNQGKADIESGNIQRIEKAVTAAYNRRRAGTEWGRTGVAMRDPTQSPAQRVRSQLLDLIVTPDSRTIDTLNTVNDKRKMALIKKEAKRTAKILRALDKSGITIDEIGEMETLDRKKIATALRVINETKASFADKEFELWRNAILSAPTTQMANIIGNVFNSFYEYAILKPTESIINLLTGNQIKGGTTVEDVGKIYKSIFSGNTWVTGWRNAVDAFINEQPVVVGSKIDMKSNAAISGKKGKIIRSPQRLLLAADEFAKGMIVQMELSAQAAMIGREQGLKGNELQNFINEQIQNTESDTWEKTLEKAKEITFQSKVGPIARNLMQIRNADGVTGYFARHILPFIVTPTNIVKTGVRRTPLGSFVLPSTLVKAYKGDLSQNQVTSRIAEQFIAWGTYFVLAALVNDKDEDGLPKFITGSSTTKTERGKRDLQYRTVPAQSIKIPGTDRWVSYSRIEPLATSLSLMVDLIHKDGNKIEEKTWTSLTGLIRDKTFMSGLSDIIDLVEKRDLDAVSEWSSKFAASYMPNIIRTALRSSDDKIRQYMVDDKDNKWKGWLKRTGQEALPHPALMPPAKVDLFGRDILKDSETGSPITDYIYRMLMPIRVQDKDPLNRIDQFIVAYNNNPPDGNEYYPVLPNTSYPDDKGITQRMNEDQYHEFLRLRGEYVAERANQINPEKLTKDEKEKLVKLFSEATKYARQKMKLKSYPSKPKLMEPFGTGRSSSREPTPFDTDRKSSREPTPFDNR